MQSPFAFSTLPVDVQYFVFTFLAPLELCIAAQVNSGWRRLSSEDTLWKNLLLRSFHVGQWMDVVISKDKENKTWKEQYKSWSSSIWSDNRSSDIALSADRRQATNKYCKDQEMHTSTWKSVLGVSGVSNKKDIRRRFNLRIDSNPYVVAAGIAPGTANVNLDLSGSNPSLSLFSNGNYYAYPSEVEVLEKDLSDFTSFSARAASSKFTTGDIISIIVDMTVGVVEFRKNDAVLTHYLLPKKLTEIEWYPAVTLSRDAKITLLPDFSPSDSLDLSYVFLTRMDVDEAKTSSSLAQ